MKRTRNKTETKRRKLQVEYLENRRMLTGDVAASAASADLMPGDTDGNGAVEFADLIQCVSNLGSTDASWQDGDFNGDKSVDIDDIKLLASNFGKTSSATNPSGELSDVAIGVGEDMGGHAESNDSSDDGPIGVNDNLDDSSGDDSSGDDRFDDGSSGDDRSGNDRSDDDRSDDDRSGDDRSDDDRSDDDGSDDDRSGDDRSGVSSSGNASYGNNSSGDDSSGDDRRADDSSGVASSGNDSSDDDGEDDRDDSFGDDSSDDHVADDNELEARLVGTNGSRGEAEFESEHGGAEREFEVEVENASPNTTYAVLVDNIFAGNVTTNGLGRGKLELSTDPEDDEKLFPADFPAVGANSTISVGDLLTGAFKLDD